MASNQIIREYKKTLEDELDWNMLGQLHSVVGNISKYCFEIKKFCVVVLIGVETLLTRFTNNKVEHSLFIAGLFIPLLFWLLDSISYYYQVKLRGIMGNIQERIIARNKAYSIVSEYGRAIEKERISSSHWKNVWSSAINHSMWLYYILIVFDIALWILFYAGII